MFNLFVVSGIGTASSCTRSCLWRCNRSCPATIQLYPAAADGYPLVLGADDVVAAGAANGGPVMAGAADVPAIPVAANNNPAIPGVADDELPAAEDNASVEESLSVEGANDPQWTSMSAFAGGLLTFPSRMTAHLTIAPDPRFFAHFMKLLHISPSD
jgi:hypothetical protein